MLKNQRAKFSLQTGTTYLNCAYMSPGLKSVEKAGIDGVKAKRNPFKISTDDFFSESESLRIAFAELINTKESNRIVIIPSVSYGLANVVNNLRLTSTDSIIVAAEQFPSNYYPWQRLSMQTGAKIKIINPPLIREGRGKRWNELLLEAIDKNTKLVALGNVHWADGTLFNLVEIRKRTKAVGALLVIDGTQSVGALPFDIQKIKPDALICGGYKWLMGPYSIGLAYYGEYFDGGTPIEENWINRLHSENFAELVNYQTDYQAGALRYEVGEHSNFILVPMMLAALKQINQWKPENIQAYCAKITSRPLHLLKESGFWVEDDEYRGQHLFGIRLPQLLKTKIVKEKIQVNKISVSFRGDAIRVAPNVYNDEKEMMKLVKVLIS
ncbi:MAG: aminotransferase class V-fold PLP-dependent enzyme [Bacteroidia bacterium]|nr:aminotransferase class V-fold PLP-dependent enzyme [Bacteroidia bacterium]